MKKLLFAVCVGFIAAYMCANPTKISYTDPYLSDSEAYSAITVMNEETGREIGEICYSLKDTYETHREIETIWVEKPFRKYGIGKELMARAIKDILHDNPREIRLTAAPTKDSDMNLTQLVGFYKKFDFDLCTSMKEGDRSARMRRLVQKNQIS